MGDEEGENGLLLQEVLRPMAARTLTEEELAWVCNNLHTIPLTKVVHLNDLVHLFKNAELNAVKKGLGSVFVPGMIFSFLLCVRCRKPQNSTSFAARKASKAFHVTHRKRKKETRLLKRSTHEFSRLFVFVYFFRS